MDHYKRMAIFARVVELGSMSAAGRLLNMSPSAVSQQIRFLEQQSGITLLHRSTRKLSLTELGERYYRYCQDLCAAAEQAQSLLESEIELPVGELRLAVPVGVARYLSDGLGAWAKQFPDLSLSLNVDDEHIDLIEQRIDLAIRVGEMPDSSFIASKISEMQMGLYVSPEWLKANAEPESLENLQQSEWLNLLNGHLGTGLKHFWNMNTLESRKIETRSKFSINNILILQQMCEQGYGVFALSTFEAHDAVRQQKLVRILPEWHVGQLNIWAVTPQRNSKSAKVRQAIQLIQNCLNAAVN